MKRVVLRLVDALLLVLQMVCLVVILVELWYLWAIPVQWLLLMHAGGA